MFMESDYSTQDCAENIKKDIYYKELLTGFKIKLIYYVKANKNYVLDWT